MGIRDLRSIHFLPLLALLSCQGGGERPAGVIRVGHFPNITHATALVAHHRTRAGTGFLEERLGRKVEWYVYNAGPSAMEAILSGAIDFAYVGPNPAINAHVRSRGDEIRVVAGATEGGSALVVRAGSGIRGPADLAGRTLATPQLGNTQDVAARAWLIDHGHRVTLTGGDVRVLPTQNPDQLALLRDGRLDAAWTVEPWVSRLELEAGGSVLLEEPDAVTTVLVASARLLAEDPELVRRFVAAHRELTAEIAADPARAQREVVAELAALTGLELPSAVLERAWPRLRFTADVRPEAFAAFLARAQRAGFLAGAEIDRLVVTP